MMILKILGALLVLWGIADIGLSYAGIDLWRDYLGVNLVDIHELVYRYSGWAAIIPGAILWSMGGSSDDEEETPTA